MTAPITTMTAMMIQMMDDFFMGVLLSLDELVESTEEPQSTSAANRKQVLRRLVPRDGEAPGAYWAGGAGIAGVLCRTRSRCAE